MKRALLAVLCAWHALGATAYAADQSEFWPELSAFIPVRPDLRVYLDAAKAKGKESDLGSVDLTAALDISLKPVLRSALQSEDWQRNRYLWARVGYTSVLDIGNGEIKSVAEHRGHLALYARAPLPAEVWTETRARADLRWTGDGYSTRYRFRVEVNREFVVGDRPVLPYFNVEWFYDTRYADWNRTLYQAGAEITVSKLFRYELYLARRNDRIPEVKTLDAFGVVGKFYF
ncbi:MAG: hypothetical protein WCA09_08155 [Burkholderiales bacterium]